MSGDSGTKAGSIWSASAGFPGIPTILPALIQEGHHKRQLPLERIAELTALHPGRIFGVGGRKGDIRAGFDADLAIVDLDWERRRTLPSSVHSRTTAFTRTDRFEAAWVCVQQRETHPAGRRLYRQFSSALHRARRSNLGRRARPSPNRTGTILDTDAVALLAGASTISRLAITRCSLDASRRWNDRQRFAATGLWFRESGAGMRVGLRLRHVAVANPFKGPWQLDWHLRSGMNCR